MPKKHDISIAGTTYSGVDTLRMTGANSEEGNTIEYICPEWDILTFNDTTPILGTYTTTKDGYSQVKITSNGLAPENIKQGVTIFGVEGTYTSSYTLSGPYSIDSTLFQAALPTNTEIIEEVQFYVPQVYSENETRYIEYNQMQIVRDSYGIKIYYDDTLAYTNTTYGNVSSYTGWQNENIIPGTFANIEFQTSQTVSETFYNWFTTVATSSDNSVEASINTGTLTLAGGNGQAFSIMLPVYQNGTLTTEYQEYYGDGSGDAEFENIVLGMPITWMALNLKPLSTSNFTNVFDSYVYNEGYNVTLGYKLLSSATIELTTYDCCFSQESKVLMADGQLKSIIEIKIGDMVMTYNEITGQQEANVVKGLGNVKLQDFTVIDLANGDQIQMNKYHPLYTQDGWKSLTQHKGLPRLSKSDELLTIDQDYIAINDIKEVKELDIKTYYTLKVEGNNNFYVNGILAQGKDKD